MGRVSGNQDYRREMHLNLVWWALVGGSYRGKRCKAMGCTRIRHRDRKKVGAATEVHAVREGSVGSLRWWHSVGSTALPRFTP